MVMEPTTSSHLSWFERDDDDRQTLEYFGKQVDRKLKPLIEVQPSLQAACVHFCQSGPTLPVQCRKVISTLMELDDFIKSLCTLFQDTDSLPIVVVALRYELLDELYYLEEQICKLIDLVDTYYEVCLAASRQVIRQRQVVGASLHALSLAIADIPQKVNFLMHEAKFRERGLASLNAIEQGNEVQRRFVLLFGESIDPQNPA